MYANILIPTDGSELAEKAIRHGVALAKVLGSKIIVLTVSTPFHMLSRDPEMIEDTAQSYKLRMQRKAEQTLVFAAVAAQAAHVDCSTLHVEHEHPYQAIIETAETKACELIVMASHGRRGLSAMVLGSETVKVLTHCKVPVLVHR